MFFKFKTAKTNNVDRKPQRKVTKITSKCSPSLNISRY